MARTKNPLVKKPNLKQEWTPELKEELAKCQKDIFYFIEKYVKIEHTLKGVIPFKIRDYQRKLIEGFKENRFCILLLPRQSGKTITTAAFLLWEAIFRFNWTIVISSNKGKNAKEIIHKIKIMYQHLPHWLKPGITDDGWNKESILFDNESRIFSETTTEDTGRSFSVSRFFIDEFAFVRDAIQREFWTSVEPTLACVAGDTKILTDNGFAEIQDYFVEQISGKFFDINNLNVWGKRGIEKVSHGYISHEADTLIIKTKHGLELEVTKEHPLYCLKNNIPEMIKSSYLTVGDYLRVDIGMNVFGNEQIDADMAYMLGGYIAKGWMKRKHKNSPYYSIYVSNTDIEFRKIYENAGFKALNSDPTKLAKHSKQLVKEYENFGITPSFKCHEKVIPKKIFSCDRETICKFLQGLFDGNGSVNERSINLTSTSKKIIQEVQLLLNNMGIISSVYLNNSQKKMEYEKRTSRLLPQGKHIKTLRDSWGLNIALSQYKKFHELIGFRIKRKEKKLLEIISRRNQDDHKLFSIPTANVRNMISDMIKKTGKNQKWFRQHGLRLDKCLDKKKNRRINVEWLDKFKSIVEKEIDFSFKEKRFFAEYLHYSHFWDEIIEIRKSKNVTFDFTVPETHSFLQNGIIGSNTGGSCIIASTPNGDTNLFAELWRSAENKINDFHAMTIKWNDVPGRTDDFKRKAIARVGQQSWEQDYECKFISSDALLINSSTLLLLTELLEDVNPIREERGFKFWKEIEFEKSYIITNDPATGSGKDFTVLECFEFPSLEHVFEYRSNETSTPVVYKLLKEVLDGIINKKSEVYFTVERNGVGEGILSLFDFDEDSPDDIMFISDKVGKKGMVTTEKIKQKYSVKLKNLIETMKIKIKSKDLLKELKNFVLSGSTYRAKSGSTDDCISAIVLLIRILEDMASWDDDAFQKLYNLADDDTIVGLDKTLNEDESPMPIIL